jgi:hypothetical protein
MVSPENLETIVLANTAEAFSAPIGYIDDPDKRRERVRIENVLSQRAFFWGGDNKLVVTPTSIPVELLQYNSRILGLNNTVNRSPSYRTHVLSENIVQDGDFLDEVEAVIKNNPNIKITSYAHTSELSGLIKHLRQRGVVFDSTEQPNQGEQLASYLDSKSGFRRVSSLIEGVLLPYGVICADFSAVDVEIMRFQQRLTPYIVKANEGESGWGLYIGKDMQTRASGDFNDGIWKSAPYVVEEYIDLDKTRGGGSPSTELYVSPDSVEVTYNCAQLFDKEGEFSGIALGKDILDAELEQRMERMSLAIGRKYRDLGYRGYFDVDFAVSKDDQLYALETNTRRTGGTHVFDLAKRLFGNDWQRYVLHSNDSFNYGPDNIPAAEVLDKLNDILYPIQGRKEGLVISLLDQTMPIMGYVLIGEEAQAVAELQVQLLDIFPRK